MLVAMPPSPNTGRPAARGAPFKRLCRVPSLAVLGIVSLSGCATPPPPVIPTVVELKITATPGVNPTQAGVGAPVVVRVYQLGSTAAFEKAEFYRLLNSDTATLGTDLVKKDEYLLAPGSTKTETLTIADTVHAIGVVAAYREFKDVTWRVDAPVPPHKTTPIVITAGSGLVIGQAP